MEQNIYIRELVVKYKSKSKITPILTDTPLKVWKFLKDKIGNEAQENLVALYLNNNTEINSWSIISKGTVSKTLIHPREIFKGAILSNASAIILAHNHPSGSTKPSNEDISITTRIIEAGAILGIKLVDHIIISETSWLSFVEEGLI